MSRKLTGVTAVAVAALVGTALIASTVPAGTVNAMSSQCTVATRDAIPIQAEPVVVTLRYTQELEGALSARLPAESKVSVVSVARLDETPMAARLTLNTTEGVAGEWGLVLRGESGTECTGMLRVSPAGGGFR